MAARFDDYVTGHMAGIKEGGGDITRSAIADVGDTYQEILMGNSGIGAPDGMTQTMENVSYEMERPPPVTPVLESDPAPEASTIESPEIAGPDIDVER